MDRITRIMKRYINIRLKKVLPLLFVCIILLACVGITGCFGSPSGEDTTTPLVDSYSAQKVRVDTTKRSDGTIKTEDGQTTMGCTWLKEFDNNGRLKSIRWDDGVHPADSETFDPPIKDPYPGLEQGHHLIDQSKHTAVPTEAPEIVEITPSSGGDHSVSEGEQAAVPTEYPTSVPGGGTWMQGDLTDII
jgi:hypothetical protein